MSDSPLPSKEKLADWLRRWYALKGELRFRDAADEIERLQRELEQMTSLAGSALPQLHGAVTRATGELFAEPFQDRVAKWMQATFDAETVSNKAERNHRFLEESLELVQSLGCTQAEAHMLVDYVFGRPVGECEQETGGVMVTLAALANANNIRVNRAAETELTRCWSKIDQIRAKQAGKPRHSPLPGLSQPPGVSVHHLRCDVRGWVCSVCHGWNDGPNVVCRHPHSGSTKGESHG